ncbi:hypothetical protein [Qipengyuania qiaonensis]|uniref:Uncharacterized protein n=1 Tax=Qipengyuania qiaonensis TaxID=2867240 RepID=A0ABS7J220_9SPHN|nr:hypothetical protein [Qipengyuania qiaonensis]MBX7481356.1 hypothetical protein [Qipengyuania qiaonensis]
MKTDTQKYRDNALFILLLEHVTGSNRYQPVKELNERYNAKIPPDLLNDAFIHWQKKGFAKIYRTGTPLSARLRRDSYGDAYEEVLSIIGATSLRVTPDLREIFSDVDPNEDLPLPDGWKWFTWEKEENRSQPNEQAPSSPISIVNNFSPVNNVQSDRKSVPNAKLSWAGWVGVLVGIASILVTLWIAGKI